MIEIEKTLKKPFSKSVFGEIVFFYKKTAKDFIIRSIRQQN
jgi:hypothetical protein